MLGVGHGPWHEEVHGTGEEEGLPAVPELDDDIELVRGLVLGPGYKRGPFYRISSPRDSDGDDEDDDNGDEDN